MDPIRGVLDERFFITANSECLAALSRLVDDALGQRLQDYLDNTAAERQVAEIIQKHLGLAIKVATFHLELLERGSVKVVEKIDLETIVNMRFDQENMIRELEFLAENMQYIRAYIEPRKKSDYDTFLTLLPAEYKSRVAANRVMFYQPRANPRATGVGSIIRKRDIWTIALKGLKFRDYFARAGYSMSSYMLKEY